MRLAKYLANAGVASRRASEQIIAAGRVTLGGETVTDPARDVDDAAEVRVDGAPVRLGSARVVYALHKPAGVVSTARDTHGRRTVVELVPSERRLYPVGRLDADTTGLILLTDDGELAHRLTHPSFEVDKTYLAVVGGGPVREAALRALRGGVELEDGPTAPARVERVSAAAGARAANGIGAAQRGARGRGREDTLTITIHEGRKRQVRRMCAAVGHPVLSLRRVRFGSLELGELPLGGYRRLTAGEITRLAQATGSAASGHAASAVPARSAPRRGTRSGAGRRRAPGR